MKIKTFANYFSKKDNHQHFLVLVSHSEEEKAESDVKENNEHRSEESERQLPMNVNMTSIGSDEDKIDGHTIEHPSDVDDLGMILNQLRNNRSKCMLNC